MRLLRKISSLFRQEYPDTNLGKKLAIVNSILKPHLDELCDSLKNDIKSKRDEEKMWNLDKLGKGMPMECILRVAILQAMNNWTFDQVKNTLMIRWQPERFWASTEVKETGPGPVFMRILLL